MSTTKKSPQKIVVALSGGIDSSVVAAILKKAGHDLIGVHLNLWKESGINPDLFPEKKCCSTDALLRARAVAANLKIPFHVFDFSEVFRTRVVRKFLAESKNARTPNPCATCCREIKFGALLKKVRELGGSALATGHYAQILKSSTGEFQIYRGVDRQKDQSYFLANLTAKKLPQILLPIGGFKKPKVRALAKKLNIPVRIQKVRES